MEARAMEALSRFKPSPACAMHRPCVSSSSLAWPNPTSSHGARSRPQCGGAHEPSPSHRCLSSTSALHRRPSPIPSSRASSRVFFRAAKGKDSKGKKKGGKRGGGAKVEPPKRTGPRPNVWSKDIAETGSRTEAKLLKQQGRIGNGIAAPKLLTELDDDFTGVVATGAIPVETQEILQTPEQMPNPLWPTFVSSNAGVWRGVGAAFSPITAEMEPVALGSSKEYLYDAAVLCSVDPIPGPEDNKIDGASLHRKVMWKVGNNQGELGFEELQDEESEFFEELDGDGGFAIDPIELASSAIAEGMVYPPEGTGEEFRRVEETKEFLQGADALYDQEDGVLRDTDPEWESMFEAGTVDAGLVEELKSVTETVKFEDRPVPAGESAPENDGVWKDVMEEDTMTLEPGLVFFSDGSYSRGPVSLMPDDIVTSDFMSPTFKIEQCLVTGKHRRVRLVHTIAIMESGEEIQVLRVAVYEEQWMGPHNMESISASGGAFLLPFSQRDRLCPTELTGSWKTFEISATAIHQPDATPMTRPAFVHFTQETILKQGWPEPLIEYFEEEDEDGEPITEDPSVLWLPGGIIANVQAKEEGILTVGVGWFYDQSTFVTMERDYGPDGKLAEVRSQTKVKGGWAGGRM